MTPLVRCGPTPWSSTAWSPSHERCRYLMPSSRSWPITGRDLVESASDLAGRHAGSAVRDVQQGRVVAQHEVQPLPDSVGVLGEVVPQWVAAADAAQSEASSEQVAHHGVAAVDEYDAGAGRVAADGHHGGGDAVGIEAQWLAHVDLGDGRG